jgi:transposase
VDEFGPLNLQHRAGVCVAGPRKRVERHRATYHRRGGVRHMFGIYDLAADQLFGRFEKRKNGRTFLSFLRWVRRKYRHAGRLHVVLDNVGYHGTAEVLAWAQANDMRFCYTPTNASWLNRIECHFTALRRFALDNSDFPSHAEQ